MDRFDASLNALVADEVTRRAVAELEEDVRALRQTPDDRACPSEATFDDIVATWMRRVGSDRLDFRRTGWKLRLMREYDRMRTEEYLISADGVILAPLGLRFPRFLLRWWVGRAVRIRPTTDPERASRVADGLLDDLARQGRADRLRAAELRAEKNAIVEGPSYQDRLHEAMMAGPKEDS